MNKKYTATYEHGDDGWWTVSIKEVRGAHSQGRSIAQARKRVLEALSLFVDDVEASDIHDDIKVGRELSQVLLRARRAQLEVERRKRVAAQASKLAARKLVKMMSVRDAGEVLKLSHQRVQQLAAGN